MCASDEPVHDLVRGPDGVGGVRAPAAPRVTPEPAPSDTVLIVASAAAGVTATLVLLAGWRIWRRRRRA